MNIRLYQSPENIMAGTTLKSPELPLDGSMALHTGQPSELVIANRQHFTAQYGIEIAQLVFANQVHSANSALVKLEDAGRGSRTIKDAFQETDALYTFESNIMLTCLTADCVPVLFWSAEHQLIGTIHSGWRGTVQEITTKTFAKIKADYPEVDLSTIQVQLGPALAQHNFEVGQEVAEQFLALDYVDEWIYFNEETGKYHIDNQSIVAEQCRRCGIDPVKILMDSMCTLDDKAGFSHRENKTPGRHLSFVMQSFK